MGNNEPTVLTIVALALFVGGFILGVVAGLRSMSHVEEFFPEIVRCDDEDSVTKQVLCFDALAKKYHATTAEKP